MSARRAASSSTDSRYPWEWRLADLPEPAEDAPAVFSTFACGGGSSMGYKRAGYRVLGNCEIDPKIAAVYAANLHPAMSYVEDIRDFNRRDDLPDELYALDVLDGSPPCSTFSTAGIREKAWGVEKRFAEGQKLQRLDDLFFAYLETVGKLRPKCFVAENVMGLVAGNARGYVHEIVRDAQAMGYAVQVFRLNAAFMGVPQRRERVFFVGNRMGWPKLKLEFSEKPVKFGDVRSAEGGGDAAFLHSGGAEDGEAVPRRSRVDHEEPRAAIQVLQLHAGVGRQTGADHHRVGLAGAHVRPHHADRAGQQERVYLPAGLRLLRSVAVVHLRHERATIHDGQRGARGEEAVV